MQVLTHLTSQLQQVVDNHSQGLADKYVSVLFEQPPPSPSQQMSAIMSMKERSGRLAFLKATHLRISKAQTQNSCAIVSGVTFSYLEDMFTVLLREANNVADFLAAGAVLDISNNVAKHNAERTEIEKLITSIASHEIWQNESFWLDYFALAAANIDSTTQEGTEESSGGTPGDRIRASQCVDALIQVELPREKFSAVWESIKGTSIIGLDVSQIWDLKSREQVARSSKNLETSSIPSPNKRKKSRASCHSGRATSLLQVASKRKSRRKSLILKSLKHRRKSSMPVSSKRSSSSADARDRAINFHYSQEESAKVDSAPGGYTVGTDKDGGDPKAHQRTSSMDPSILGEIKMFSSTLSRARRSNASEDPAAGSLSPHHAPRLIAETARHVSSSMGNAKPTLLLGERLLWRVLVKTSRLCRPEVFTESLSGYLFLTNYRLFFSLQETNQEVSVSSLCRWFFNVPLMSVSKLDLTSTKDGQVLVFHCKDYRVVAFVVNSSEVASGRVQPFFLLAEKYAFCDFPPSARALENQSYIASPVPFSFLYKARWVNQSLVPPFRYDAADEYERMGALRGVRSSWRASHMNSEYQFCPTYPRLLMVPKSQTDAQIAEAAQFRSKQRFPCLSYLHPRSGAALLRCSQPFVGLRGKRNLSEEKYLQDAGIAVFLDCRPKKSAMANMAAGKGYENVHNYDTPKRSCKLSFCDIENIHSVRKAHHSLTELCMEQSANSNSTGNSWLSSVENTRWLKHLRLILAASKQAAIYLEDSGIGVLVHCSDGWDRTSQVCALAQLILDPFYRSIRGFATIVEKEWCSFGHQFARRTGHGSKKYSDDQRAPIFLQFLDCVWQLWEQFPTAFEFNEEFLFFVADSSTSCRFGNFLYDCERQRVEAKTAKSTECLWTFVVSRIRSHFPSPAMFVCYRNHITHQLLLFPPQIPL